MPTYDYQCRSCGHTLEVIHSMLEDGPSVCERCGGDLRRVLFPSGIIFKGSGFYKTDSRSSSSASVAPSTRPSGGSDGDSGGSAASGGVKKDKPKGTGDAPKGGSGPTTGSAD